VLVERAGIDRTVELLVAGDRRIGGEDRAKELVASEVHLRDTDVPKEVLGQVIGAVKDVERRVPNAVGGIADNVDDNERVRGERPLPWS